MPGHDCLHDFATGSVTGANCKELAAKPDVDGFLVGGASLKVKNNTNTVERLYRHDYPPDSLNTVSLSLFCSLNSSTSSTPPP